MERFYYYTRWKFKPGACGDLDHEGPYHSTHVTDSPPKEFMSYVWADGLDEYFVKQFNTKEEMISYWDKMSQSKE